MTEPANADGLFPKRKTDEFQDSQQLCLDDQINNLIPCSQKVQKKQLFSEEGKMNPQAMVASQTALNQLPYERDIYNYPAPLGQDLPFKVRQYRDRFKNIYQSNQFGAPVGSSQICNRKRKNGLTDDEVRLLQVDLKRPNMNKKVLMNKYAISESTINRYIRRFNQLEKEGRQFTPYPTAVDIHHYQELEKNMRSYSPTPPPPSSESGADEGNEDNTDYDSYLVRKKNSKVRLIESKLMQIYKIYPQIYQSQAAAMLSKYFQTDISIHVVSRCLRNIAVRQKEMQKTKRQHENRSLQGFYESLQQNSPKNIEYRFSFAREFLLRNEKKIVYIDEAFYRRKLQNGEEKIHFALAVSGEGKIVHWKLKAKEFKPEQIGKFLEEIAARLSGYTFLLENVKLHRQPFIRQLLKTKAISHLYLPPCSPQLNPIVPIFGIIVQEFKKKLSNDLGSHEALRLAHFTIMQVKEKTFTRQVESARHFIDIAYRRDVFPFDRMPHQKH